MTQTSKYRMLNSFRNPGKSLLSRPNFDPLPGLVARATTAVTFAFVQWINTASHAKILSVDLRVKPTVGNQNGSGMRRMQSSAR